MGLMYLQMLGCAQSARNRRMLIETTTSTTPNFR